LSDLQGNENLVAACSCSGPASALGAVSRRRVRTWSL